MDLSKMFMVSENLWHKTETQHTEQRNYMKSCYKIVKICQYELDNNHPLHPPRKHSASFFWSYKLKFEVLV